MYNKDTYCTCCGNMYGENNICPNCGNHNISAVNNMPQNYNFDYSPKKQNYSFQNNQQPINYNIQNPAFYQSYLYRAKKPNALNYISIISIVIAVIMLALSCLSFYIIPSLIASNAKIEKIARENIIALTNLNYENSDAKKTIPELTKTVEGAQATIDELNKKAAADKATVDQLYKDMNANKATIAYLQKYDENYYRNNIAFVRATDNTYYHILGCTAIGMRQLIAYDINEASVLGYKPCPKCH